MRSRQLNQVKVGAAERDSEMTFLYERTMVPSIRASGPPGSTHLVRRVPVDSNAIKIGFLAICTALGILAGTAIAFHETRPATKPNDVATVSKPPALTVVPIAEPAAAPAVAVAPTPAPVAPPAPAPHRAASAPATGTLRVTTTPPCAITIDDHPTGLISPQAAMTLPVGHHQVTLSNMLRGIQVTAQVEITADHTTPLAEDFSHHDDVKASSSR